MVSYRAPVRDMLFVVDELGTFSHTLATVPAFADVDQATIQAILEEASKFTAQELLPINATGDAQGCRLQEGRVITPDGFKAAYQQFVTSGWPSLSGDPHYGGQGLPHSINVCVDEMLSATNMSFQLYPNLTQGVVRCLGAHASTELKACYLPPMIEGRWAGAMCLTESHCGTDLGLIRTKAEPMPAVGQYAITGTKIFITGGDQDLTENIIHLVLARLPDAPRGVRGISLFLVPMFLVDEDGQLGAKNTLDCSALEHKMGIRGSATCVMQYEAAAGYLVGELNAGLAAMFTVMNIERLAIGVQGLGLAEIAYQNALEYAKTRLQGRAAVAPLLPDELADPLIVHPDIRRLLLTMKSFIEGARALAGWVYQAVDLADHHTDVKVRQRAKSKVDLFTPVIKAYLSDEGFIQCNHALQVLGGHGYIVEWGIEQWVRDARISSIYEGANGIQALDLVKRKLVLDQGQALGLCIDEVQGFLTQISDEEDFSTYLSALSTGIEELKTVSTWIIEGAAKDPALMGAVSYDYMNLLSQVGLAYQWARMMMFCKDKQADVFYQAKIQTGIFFFQKIWPKNQALITSIKSGSEAVMVSMDDWT